MGEAGSAVRACSSGSSESDLPSCKGWRRTEPIALRSAEPQRRSLPHTHALERPSNAADVHRTNDYSSSTCKASMAAHPGGDGEAAIGYVVNGASGGNQPAGPFSA